ncbi:hypothetical protein BBG47_19955 [Paenibacillus sp. KS1]|uniref:hypothetical protein n=1 Tax=Paenibacillus sp. KS1 TaxID=1849249 RepID=UPI00080650EE|nr:hypothetical protein [Paenibacillus sp. KS1]OBY77766.1 hypothetical protein BBG47_19955 [Paenibacillus sp. KS1]
MIVCSKERYIPVTINTLVLHKEDRYYYVHRDVYDQAVILADRYADLEHLMELVGGTSVNQEIVEWFYQQAPRPLHILAPYLRLVDGALERNIEICCGVLHAITAMISVRNFILKPQEIRKSVSFSLTAKEEYEMAWDRFFLSAIPYEERYQAAPKYRSVTDQKGQVEPANSERGAQDCIEQQLQQQPIVRDAIPKHRPMVNVEPIETSMMAKAKREHLVEAAMKPAASTQEERIATKQLLL